MLIPDTSNFNEDGDLFQAAVLSLDQQKDNGTSATKGVTQTRYRK